MTCKLTSAKYRHIVIAGCYGYVSPTQINTGQLKCAFSAALQLGEPVDTGFEPWERFEGVFHPEVSPRLLCFSLTGSALGDVCYHISAFVIHIPHSLQTRTLP